MKLLIFLFSKLNKLVIITQQRDKCIGCGYCVEAAPNRWRMSKLDGKCHLLGSKNKKGFHTVRVDDLEHDENFVAAEICPVKIIKVTLK